MRPDTDELTPAAQHHTAVRPPLTITVGLPDRALCGNGRLYHLARTRLVRLQRQEAFYAAREALQRAEGAPGDPDVAHFPTGRVRVSVVVYRQTSWATRRLDDDNLWRGLKATLDGFQDARVVANDRQFQMGEILWEKARPTEGRVISTLTPLPS